MPSPFPGMDPFIEASGLWGDFHGGMLAAIRAELNQRLPRGYAATIDLYVWTPERKTVRRRRRVEPDVYVREEKRGPLQSTGTTTIAAPNTILLPAVERRKRRSVKIMDVRTRQVITVIELLSPSNKEAGDDRKNYLDKRNEYLANGLNLVEIDLLRSGQRSPLGNPPPPIADFCVMVCRSWEFPRAGFWTFTIRDPLPEIPIPLTQELPEPTLPLRSCVDRAYDEGRYADSLSYAEPLRPRLGKEDAAWVRKLLAERSTEATS
jgi:hypothetical protein